MTQKDLIYIKTIADEGGISPAAKKLFLSQPSLSQSVKRIEDSLGVALFNRTPRGLVLTHEGLEYYQMATRILSIYSSFAEGLKDMKDLKTGSFSMGTSPHQGLRLLPKFLANFHLKYPGIEIKIKEGSADDLEEALLKGTIDFALMRDLYPGGTSRSFTSKGLFRVSFLILLPPGHPAGKHAVSSSQKSIPTLDPKWLMEENFLLSDPSQRLRDMVLEILRKAGITDPKSNYSSIYTETLAILAAAGQGVALLPSEYYSPGSLSPAPDCYLIPEEYGAFWNNSLVTLKDASLPRAASVFLDELGQYMNEQRGNLAEMPGFL